MDSRASIEQQTADAHEFRAPRETDSRCPCPALNALANHGYLPRDGRNIHVSKLIEVLQRKDTYNLSPQLAHFLARVGILITKPGAAINDKECIDLHDLAVHRRIGVEHNASVTHKDAAPGCRMAPSRTDTLLLDHFCGDLQTIDLSHVALSRVELESASHIDGFHAEVARGEWALVLDIFGRAHGGQIPVDALRTWLKENRFPDGWHPDHQQGLLETVNTSKKIREQMGDIRERGVDTVATREEIQHLKDLLTTSPTSSDSQ